MADNKRSFVAYSDWKETFDKLPDEIAGKLIKHIFAYVNDENPISDDFVIEAVFSNIKNTLKRDLKKWESQMEQRRLAGKKSAEQRALTKVNERSISLNENTRNPTVSVSVNDSVSVNVNDSSKEEKNNIILKDLLNSEMWIETTAMQTHQKFVPDKIKEFLKEFNSMINLKFDYKINKSDYCSHFLNWLNKQEKESITVTKKDTRKRFDQ